MELKFEQAMQQLNEIVEKLSGGTMPLDEMVKLYEKGEKLSKHCLKLLDDFDARLDTIDQKNAEESQDEPV